MISGRFDRRRRALFWSTLASAAIHLIILTLLFYAVARIFVPRGSREVVSQTQIVTIKKVAPPPTPAPPHPARHVRQRESSPATVPRQEIAKEVPRLATPEPQEHHISLPSKLERDQAGFAREVAQLNAQNDPHAIPTIDPAARESSTKSYAFQVPSSSGDEHGNGIITPTRSWHDSGLDCYYGRYEYTYPDGSEESGEIQWPFCYNPGSDPFKLPPHPIPFPLPLPGFKLSAEDVVTLPSIEKQVYQSWAAANGSGSSP